MNNGYSICFNEWALDPDIKNDLRLLVIISSLTAEKGYCYASNKYFAELFETTEETISRKIKNLEDKNYITIDYEKRGCQVLVRKIRLTKISTDDYQKYQSTIDENIKENNISINNTSINNIYGEFKNVKLSEVEYKKLKEKNLLTYIETLSCYLKNHPRKKYASHYATILTWSRNNVKDNKPIKKDIIPDWFNKDLNKVEDKKEDDLNEEQRELINKILGKN